MNAPTDQTTNDDVPKAGRRHVQYHKWHHRQARDAVFGKLKAASGR